MALLWFQETLETFLHDMEAVLQNRQVVLLICGLMSDPTPVIHLVCQHWKNAGQESAGKALIGYMFHEAGLQVPKDYLHNQGINFYDHLSSKNDTTPVYFPSRLYWFGNITAKIPCNIQHGNTDVPECTISIIHPDERMTENLLSICHIICQNQAIRNFYINGGRWAMPLIQQINRCSTLRVLDLSHITLTGYLSSFLPDPHPGLPELQQLNLDWISLNQEDVCHLLSIAYKLPRLRRLDLSYSFLTGCLSSFLPDPHPGLSELRELNLCNTDQI